MCGLPVQCGAGLLHWSAFNTFWCDFCLETFQNIYKSLGRGIFEVWRWWNNFSAVLGPDMSNYMCILLFSGVWRSDTMRMCYRTDLLVILTNNPNKFHKFVFCCTRTSGTLEPVPHSGQYHTQASQKIRTAWVALFSVGWSFYSHIGRQQL